jgi:uncharacterized protein YyaL (SSP411 family)
VATWTTHESKIELRAVQKVHKDLGVLGIKLTTKSGTGWPDRMFLVPGGRPFFIEFKQPGEEPRPKQDFVHALLRRLGYDVEAHDTVEGAVAAVGQRVDAARAAKARDEVPDRARSRHRRS